MEQFFVEALIFFIIAAVLVRVIRFPMGKWRVASFIGMLIASLFYLFSTAVLWMTLQKPLRAIFKIDFVLTLLVGGVSFALLYWDILRRQKVMMKGKKGVAEMQNALKMTFVSPEYWVMFILYFVSWLAFATYTEFLNRNYYLFYPLQISVLIIGIILYRLLVMQYGRQAVKFGVIKQEENVWQNRTVIACFEKKDQTNKGLENE